MLYSFIFKNESITSSVYTALFPKNSPDYEHIYGIPQGTKDKE